MNSFYGQMRWGEKFEQFFYEFRLTNRLFSDKNTFNENPSVDGGRPTVKTNEYRIWIQPNKDFALFDINAANHWLKLVPLDSKGDAIEYQTNAGFSIYHNSPDVDNGVKLPIFELLTSKPSGTVESLQSGGYFKITNPKFDQAGHFTGKDEAENSYFQLPKQIIRINSVKDLSLKTSDQKFHFLEHQDAAAGDDGTNNNLIQLILNSNQDELTFEHKKYFTKDSTKTMFKFLNDEKGTKYETDKRRRLCRKGI